MTIQELMAKRIIEGLTRNTATTCSKWAEKYRFIRSIDSTIPKLWTFKYHPWTRAMHDSKAPVNVGQKGAQLGFSELALNLVFYNIDIHNRDCLYVLPAKTPDATDFSASRFDPALEDSPHLSNLFSNVKNVGLKRAGSASLYIRGSRSKSALKSIPVGLIIFDEVDEMDQENIPLARERTSGQKVSQEWFISTPTVPNYGINTLYETSSKESYSFRCQACGKATFLVFPECLVITGEHINDPNLLNSHLICKECKNKLDHATKYIWLQNGEWVAEHPDRTTRGFSVSQLYSSTVLPSTIARAVLLAESDPATEQELYNSKLGLPRVVSKTQLTETHLTKTIKNYTKGPIKDKLITMGVDVGKWLHVEIAAWTVGPGPDYSFTSFCHVINETKVPHFEQLDDLFRQYNVRFCVIDAQPEKRKSLEFAHRFGGRVALCYYNESMTGKDVAKTADEPTITVNRTSWMDLSLGRFWREAISLPKDVSMEYRQHILAPMRVYERTRHGEPVARYINGNLADHFAHAHTYNELAFKSAIGAGSAQNINVRL